MEYSSTHDVIENDGVILVKEFLSKSIARFLSTYMNYHYAVTGNETVMGIDTPFESLLESMWEHVSFACGKDLVPTSSSAILYSNGSTVEPFVGAEENEYMVIVELGRTDNYAWPIYINNERFDLEEGDALIYKGNVLEYQRKLCDGPKGYLTSALYLNYVDKNGDNYSHENNSVKDQSRRNLKFSAERNEKIWMRINAE
jgi:hypothetical protein